jgi:hypothetical protein
LANLDERIDSVEDKLVEDMENTAAKIDVVSNSIEKQTEERRKLHVKFVIKNSILSCVTGRI